MRVPQPAQRSPHGVAGAQASHNQSADQANPAHSPCLGVVALPAMLACRGRGAFTRSASDAAHLSSSDMVCSSCSVAGNPSAMAHTRATGAGTVRWRFLCVEKAGLPLAGCQLSKLKT